MFLGVRFLEPPNFLNLFSEVRLSYEFLLTLQSVSSEEAVPVFELSRGSTVSSDNGVFPLRNSEGDDRIPDVDSLDGDESTTEESLFIEPQVISLWLSQTAGREQSCAVQGPRVFRELITERGGGRARDRQVTA